MKSKNPKKKLTDTDHYQHNRELFNFIFGNFIIAKFMTTS